MVAGTLRRGDGGPGRFVASLAEVHVRGVTVDWAAVLPGGRRVDLPTYAFRHQAYWPRGGPARAGDVAAAGLGAVGHPLLGAAVELAGGDGYMFTGRLSLRAQPWLADHAVNGVVLLPGTAFAEMVVRAGDAAGCGRIRELALEVPLVLPADQAVLVQVTVGEPDVSGARPVSVYGRPGDAGTQGPWTRHASGLLAPGEAADPGLAAEFAVWPPLGAVPVPVDGFYPGLAAGGYGYGPAFRGLRAAWRRGVTSSPRWRCRRKPRRAPGRSGCIRPCSTRRCRRRRWPETDEDQGRGSGPRLPFAWTGVSVYATGAPVLRVRLRQATVGEFALVAADGAGLPVISVDRLVSRPVPAGQLEAAAGGLADALFTVEWVPVPGAVPSRSPGPMPPGPRWCTPGCPAPYLLRPYGLRSAGS